MRRFIPRCAPVMAAVALLAAAPNAMGGMVIFDLDTVITGSPPASPELPWLRATFADSASDPNAVLLRMEAVNLTRPEENVKSWAFNINPDLSSNLNRDLRVVYRDSSELGLPISVTIDEDSIKGWGDAGFRLDFSFGYVEGDGAETFQNGDWAEF